MNEETEMRESFSKENEEEKKRARAKVRD